MNIKKAAAGHINECVKILQDSELGEAYFSDYEKANSLIANAVNDEEIYAAIGENGECLGFIYYKPQGMFGNYPYLHIIAVKKEFRSKGIGRQLIAFFEDECSSSKYFLTVDDFNERAKRLYEKLGYACVSTLADFYKKDISVYLMMKSNL